MSFRICQCYPRVGQLCSKEPKRDRKGKCSVNSDLLKAVQSHKCDLNVQMQYVWIISSQVKCRNSCKQVAGTFFVPLIPVLKTLLTAAAAVVSWASTEYVGFPVAKNPEDGVCLDRNFGTPLESVIWTLSWQEASIFKAAKTVIKKFSCNQVKCGLGLWLLFWTRSSSAAHLSWIYFKNVLSF